MRSKLNSKKILEKIEKNREVIRKFGVKRIGLFGSFMKGEEKRKSDIDFIVSFDKIGFNNYINLLLNLEKMFGKKIDLVIEKDLKPELSYIKKEAQYAKL